MPPACCGGGSCFGFLLHRPAWQVQKPPSKATAQHDGLKADATGAAPEQAAVGAPECKLPLKSIVPAGTEKAPIAPQQIPSAAGPQQVTEQPKRRPEPQLVQQRVLPAQPGKTWILEPQHVQRVPQMRKPEQQLSQRVVLAQPGKTWILEPQHAHRPLLAQQQQPGGRRSPVSPIAPSTEQQLAHRPLLAQQSENRQAADPRIMQKVAPAPPASMAAPQMQHAQVVTAVVAAPQTAQKDSPARLRDSLRMAARRFFSEEGVTPLTRQEEEFMTDETMGIYIRARETEQAQLDILVPTLRWRISNREALASKECPCCLQNPLSHDARLFGFDRDGDYVFMNCFELPRDISVESVIRHMTCLLERALTEFEHMTKMPLEADGHPRTRKWTFIFDLYGFGMRYYDPRVTMRLLELFQVVHRGRLKKLLVLDAPGIFGGFFRMVQPFFKPATREKLVFSAWGSVRPELEADFGPALTEELFNEAMENRDAEKCASKTWTTFYGSSMAQARAKLPQLRAGSF